MKDKIIMLIVGIIIGAVIAGACFWFATSIMGNGRGNMPEDMQGKGTMRQDQNFTPNENMINAQNSTNSNS